MVHHVSLYKLKPGVTPEQIEAMMMTTRMSLLKIPEVLSVKCGKNIDPGNEWKFFVALDFESLEKLAMTEEEPIYMKFHADVIRAHTSEKVTYHYEMEPGKNVQFS